MLQYKTRKENEIKFGALRWLVVLDREPTRTLKVFGVNPQVHDDSMSIP